MINSLISCSDEEQLLKGIYKITNIITNQTYIGSVYSNNPKSRRHFRRRWLRHLSLLIKGTHVNSYLQNSFNKYGMTSFKFEIIEIIESNKELDFILQREQFYLDTLQPFAKTGKGFNVNKTAQVIMYNKPTKASTSEKIRKALLGKPRPLSLKIQLGKPVVQYSLNGEYIQEFYSTMEASRVTGVCRVAIKNCVKNRIQFCRTAGGFIWKYKNSFDN